MIKLLYKSTNKKNVYQVNLELTGSTTSTTDTGNELIYSFQNFSFETYNCANNCKYCADSSVDSTDENPICTICETNFDNKNTYCTCRYSNSKIETLTELSLVPSVATSYITTTSKV